MNVISTWSEVQFGVSQVLRVISMWNSCWFTVTVTNSGLKWRDQIVLCQGVFKSSFSQLYQLRSIRFPISFCEFTAVSFYTFNQLPELRLKTKNMSLYEFRAVRAITSGIQLYTYFSLGFPTRYSMNFNDRIFKST